MPYTLELPVDSHIQLVLTLTIGFALASLLGYITQRAKLSPILGYLIAGYIIGPFSPGFVANLETTEQLAEVGVILMMFGVGLHFKWQELASVKNIAIPGAIGQTFIAAAAGTWLLYSMGWTLQAGLVIGLSIGVASTVVMVRVLSDNKLLATNQGHIAIGWLIVEDIITVIVLLLLPSLAAFDGEGASVMQMGMSILWAFGKCALLILFISLWGFKLVNNIFKKITRTRSQELFTITVLALTFAIATGSALLFGTSIALGAFIAGMMIGQTEVRHQAFANSLPLKDAFAVLFFLSVGMLFNPMAILDNFWLFLAILLIILIIKPLSAYIIVRAFKYPVKTAVVVAIALAQIGEFSFILSEEAMKLDFLPEIGYDLIVACALISIAINPLFFKASKLLARTLDNSSGHSGTEKAESSTTGQRFAIVVGYGPVGRSVAYTLEQMGFWPVVIDNNVDTIATLAQKKHPAVFGDASSEHILNAAHLKTADLLVITIPEGAAAIGDVALRLNPKIKVIARVNFSTDQQLLREMGIQVVNSEEETRQAFISALRHLETNFSY